MSQEILNEHERRLTQIEAKVEQLVPRVDVMEMIAPLHQKMNSMEATIEHFMQGTEAQITRIATDLGQGMKRLGELHEENLRSAARHEDEKHRAEMALKDERIKLLQQLAEDRRWQNRVKNDWLPLFGVIVSGASAAGLLWQLASWILRHL